jgi:hypothetical protein
MPWPALIVVGFFLMTALVIALARSSTARWERDRRAARAPWPDGVAPPPAGAAPWLRARLVRTAATAQLAVVRARTRIGTAHGSVQPAHQAGDLSTRHGTGQEAPAEVALPPGTPAARPGTTGPVRGRVSRRLRRPFAGRFHHRHAPRQQDARGPQAGADKSSTAG